MTNDAIADIFLTIADILELKGENVFRVRAYRRAAQSLHNLSNDISRLTAAGKLSIPGIGDDLEAKIRELVDRGSLTYYEQLKKTVPAGLLAIMGIPGIGPKKTRALHEQLGITTVAQLERAARCGRAA